ncbi:MAG: hypothetical protein K9M10_02720 [Candidatus Pacebacteria bacterium]|nr:hypothetical protein [Candidatus Paceibacterota bacterium]MCF7857367.1 hypothetical protein [Candidatus Paceibacterota bacterium]
MSTTYWRENTLVRHKGEIVSVQKNGDDRRELDNVSSGDRRSRQIGKRHWLRKESNGWNSGGGYWDYVSMKLPGKPERNLRRPVDS